MVWRLGAKVEPVIAVHGNVGEFTFEQQCIADKLPDFEREYRFHVKRQFRFDFAWPQFKVALEVDGGIFSHGAHGRPMNILRDMEKSNLATFDGWHVLHYTPAQVKVGLAIAGIKQLLARM